MATPELSISPAAKHRKSAFGFEPSYEKRWDSVMQLQVLQQKTPHRYQQSPVFARKALSSPPEEQSHKHHHHHHHHHHKRSPRMHRRRGNSEGDKGSTTSSSSSSSSSHEKVHILSDVPWKRSDSESSSSSSDSLEEDPHHHPTLTFSTTLPHRLDSRLQLERNREAQRRSPCPSPLASRRIRPRTRSQGMSPLPRRKLDANANEMIVPEPNQALANLSEIEYKAHMVIDIRPIMDPVDKVLSPTTDPTTPVTPLVDANGFLQLPPMVPEEGLPPPPSPHTLRCLMGIEDNLQDAEGLTEEEIIKARVFARRFSSSSESSTSTLT